MGIFKLIGKRGAARALARSAHEVYLKYKTGDPSLSEQEIAQTIFMQRCSPENLNKAEKIRFEKYLETEGKVDSLIKLCLAMVHILLNISSTDVKACRLVEKIIEEELTRAG